MPVSSRRSVACCIQWGIDHESRSEGAHQLRRPGDRVFFPGAGVRRLAARNVLSHYEAAKPSRLRKSRNANGSPNAGPQMGIVGLRGLARNLEANYDIARGALRTLVNNVVGARVSESSRSRVAVMAPSMSNTRPPCALPTATGPRHPRSRSGTTGARCSVWSPRLAA